MIRSMTGYGSSEKATAHLRVKVEIKSLNGKFMELNLRSPKIMNAKELEIRNIFTPLLDRGTIQFYINLYHSNAVNQEVKINTELAKNYYTKLTALEQELGSSTADIFKWILDIPEIMNVEEADLSEEDYQLILATCEDAYEQLDSFRLAEGDKMKTVLHAHCNAIGAAIPKLEALEEERLVGLKSRIEKGLKDLASDENYDKNRFEQELIYYLEKYDITEEKNRLKAHCLHFEETLSEGAKGKKLGFIGQEMGREINTLGSKANHAGMQRIVISMKEELEKIKEQVLNIV